MLTVSLCNNWLVDVGVLWLRDYTFGVDNLLYVFLVERRGSKYVIRFRKFVVWEKGTCELDCSLCF